VPLGIFLSSGLDSTAIAALASRERAGLHTFTVVFPEQEFSEAAMARRTAERLGTRHEELLLTGDEMQARLGEAVSALDEPSADGINTFFVSWAARQVGLKVALSGLGGDEVFGGYPTFRTTPQLARLAALAHALPAAASKPLAAILARFAASGNGRADAGAKIRAIVSRPDALPHPYFFARMLFTPGQADALLPPGRAGAAEPPAKWREWLEQAARQARQIQATQGSDSAVSLLELRTYMLDMLLRDTDSMSMHHSLEVRVPLLDHPLVEFAASLPTSAKRKRGLPKALLVEALGDLLPREVIEQPKRTFTFPFERWLRGPLGAQVAQELGASASAGGLTPSLTAHLDAAGVRRVWQNFESGRTGWARPWSLFVLNHWVRTNIDEASGAAETPRERAGSSVGSAAETGRRADA
jgi:asparagine synthase (glutamine-hydrolysing)